MTLNWYSTLFGTADGYGNSAERMIQALEAGGTKVSVERGYSLCSSETLIRNVLDQPYVEGTVRIAYTPPSSFWLRSRVGQPTLGFTMWEDDTLPPTWNDALGYPDAIGAPSQFCCAVIERRLAELDLDKRVYRIPLGVAHADFPYRERSYDPARDTFTFLWTARDVGDTRKNAAGMIAAFQEAFPLGGGQRVKLIMRAAFGAPVGAKDDPRIEWRIGPITEAQKLALLYEAHAYVCPSFGEGFGLMPLEAIASGLPAICSENSALAEYSDLFLPVACDPEPSGILGAGGVVQTKGTWMRPRQRELVGAMRAMRELYPRWSEFTAIAADRVRFWWGYDRTARRLLEVAEDLRRVRV